MIDDSNHWKVHLHCEIASLKSILHEDETESEHYDAIEMYAFTTAFIIRKLADSKRLSIEATYADISVSKFPRRRYDLTDEDLAPMSKLYNFGKGRKCRVGLRDLCNELIHSHDFMVTTNEAGRQWTIWFASDSHRNERCIAISLTRFVRLTAFVVSDDWSLYGRRMWIEDLHDFGAEMHELKARSSPASPRKHSARSVEGFFDQLWTQLRGGMNPTSAYRRASQTYLKQEYGGPILIR